MTYPLLLVFFVGLEDLSTHLTVLQSCNTLLYKVKGMDCYLKLAKMQIITCNLKPTKPIYVCNKSSMYSLPLGICVEV